MTKNHIGLYCIQQSSTVKNSGTMYICNMISTCKAKVFIICLEIIHGYYVGLYWKVFSIVFKFIPNSLTHNENISIIDKLFSVFNLSIPLLHLFKVTGFTRVFCKCHVLYLHVVLQWKLALPYQLGSIE